MHQYGAFSGVMLRFFGAFVMFYALKRRSDKSTFYKILRKNVKKCGEILYFLLFSENVTA